MSAPAGPHVGPMSFAIWVAIEWLVQLPEFIVFIEHQLQYSSSFQMVFILHVCNLTHRHISPKQCWTNKYINWFYCGFEVQCPATAYWLDIIRVTRYECLQVPYEIKDEYNQMPMLSSCNAFLCSFDMFKTCCWATFQQNDHISRWTVFHYRDEATFLPL